MPLNHSEARQFGQLDLLARQVVEGFITGLHQSPFHGFSVSLLNIAFIMRASPRGISTGNCMAEPISFL